MSADRQFTQYTQIAGPLTTAAPQETTAGWFPESQPVPVRKFIPIALTVMACVLPPTNAQGAVNPPTGWRPRHPDAISRKVVHPSRVQALAWNTSTPATIQPESGRIIATGSIQFIQYQQLAGAFLDPPAVAPTGWSPEQAPPPVNVPRILPHPSRMQAWAFDRYDAPTAPTVTGHSWGPRYPDAIARTSLPVANQRAFFPDAEVTTGVFASQNSAWAPRITQQHRPRYSLATYTWAQQHFPVVVDVPVMSWTGLYLDPPVRRKRVTYSGSAGVLDVTAQPPAPDNSWGPRYRDQVPPRRRNHAALTSAQHGLIFVPDVTNTVTVLSWSARYPDRVDPKRSLGAPLQLAFAFDRFTAPTPVTSPDLSVPVYPDRVYGKPRVVHFPDLQAVIGRQDPPPIVPDNSWGPRYRDFVPAKPGLIAAKQLAFTFWPDPIPTPSVTPVTGEHQLIVPYRERQMVVSARKRTITIPLRKRTLP